MRILITFFALFLSLNIISEERVGNLKIIENKILISNFCDFRIDHFYAGIDLKGNNQDVLSAEDSEVVFKNIDRKGSIKYGNGQFIVLEDIGHKKRFYYSNLKEGSIDKNRIFYKKDEKIAIAGNSGSSVIDHLHFEIEDIVNRKIINPLQYIEVLDTIPPKILDIYFVTQNYEKISIVDNYKVVRGGKLYVKCQDIINNSNYLLAPYKITLYINGIEKASFKFDSLYKLNNSFFMANNLNFKDIYANNEAYDFYIIDYHSLPDIIGFKLIVEDFNGNKREFKKNLIMELPKKEK